MVRRGKVRQLRFGLICRGQVRSGVAVKVGSGKIWCGLSGSGEAVKVRPVKVGCGDVRFGMAVKARLAVFRSVMACSGKVRYGSRGRLRHVKVWSGAAR